MMHRKRWIIVLVVASIFPNLSLPARQGAASLAGTQGGPSESSSGKKSKHNYADDLLIRGTVFNDRALSLQSAKLRIRRVHEKKSRWETLTNFRGEFAVRVPQGADYEIVAESKGYAPQSRAINAKDGEQNIVFHMQPLKGSKP